MKKHTTVKQSLSSTDLSTCTTVAVEVFMDLSSGLKPAPSATLVDGAGVPGLAYTNALACMPADQAEGHVAGRHRMAVTNGMVKTVAPTGIQCRSDGAA